MAEIGHALCWPYLSVVLRSSCLAPPLLHQSTDSLWRPGLGLPTICIWISSRHHLTSVVLRYGRPPREMILFSGEPCILDLVTAPSVVRWSKPVGWCTTSRGTRLWSSRMSDGAE